VSTGSLVTIQQAAPYDMSRIEFVEVRPKLPATGELWGANIEFPRENTQTDGVAIDIIGWVVGRESHAIAVEARVSGLRVCRVPVDMDRPDVADYWRHVVPDAMRSGFHISVPMGGSARIDIAVDVVLRDQRRVYIGTVRAHRQWRENPDSSQLPFVSVIIPCFNQARFLDDALASVMAQTYPHYEVVVVDDGSDDNTQEVACRFPGVRYVRQRNAGLSAARNTGLRRSGGDFLVFLDADDRLEPDALERGLSLLSEHSAAAFVAGKCRYIAVDGTPVSEQPARDLRGDAFAALIRRCHIHPPAVAMYRRSAFDSVGTFDEQLSPCADYDMYLRIARQYPVHIHDHVTAEYRKHGASMNGDHALMLESAIRVLRLHRGFIRRQPELRKAYRDGVQYVQQCYGRPLTLQLRALVRAFEVRRALPVFVTLVRYYPRGILRLLRRSKSHGTAVRTSAAAGRERS
jgi:glycosyltransferase involved in cell wall biosynthesis